ncbi:brefeldin A-inhibited guanine nucleotide-exchange protein [Striga asiatica]|uniref:Brefeldin A-inhibited guanine nucleotide-exchange protein n=1 Tax=Striga asiatica TaxID=4170 RepID=A0A5A7Q8K5_STRAF|nr:brefeldin A-inhibited guanine nucleotide-exchange protein [Striga asiatica]
MSFITLEPYVILRHPPRIIKSKTENTVPTPNTSHQNIITWARARLNVYTPQIHIHPYPDTRYNNSNRHRPILPGQRPHLTPLLFILPRHLLQRPPLRLRHQQREKHPQRIYAPEHNQRVLHPNSRRVTRIPLARVLGLCCVQKPESPYNRPCFPCRRRYPVTRRPQPRRKYLRRDHESRRVRPEIREEERERVHHHEPDPIVRVSPVVVRKGEREHENRHETEPHELDREPPDSVDEEDREPVAGHRAAEGYQSLCARDSVNLLERVHGPCWRDPPDGAEYVLLEENAMSRRNHVDVVPSRWRPCLRRKAREKRPNSLVLSVEILSSFSCSGSRSTWRTLDMSAAARLAFLATRAV